MTLKYGQYKRLNYSLKSLGILFCLTFCVFLQSSTTHYSPMLRYYLLQEELKSSYQGLWPAAKEGSDVALDALARLAEVNGDVHWLEKAASLNSLYAQVALGNITEGEQQIYWWRQASNNGHGPSQFELSLSVESTQQRIRYLEQAALNEHIPAIIALSKYYYEENDANNALRWLGKASQYDHTNILKLAKILWQQGEYKSATEAFERASEKDPAAKIYFTTIKNVARQSLGILSKPSSPIGDVCAQHLQFVATSLESAVQASTFKNRFDQDARLAQLPICIKPVIWLADNELSCELVEHRKVCDLTKLAELAFSPSYTHLVFFLNEGKGYVENGAMYLDEADTYSVFVHELAHFVGFVDEYAVSSSLALQYCNESDAPNLIVSANEDLYDEETFQMWKAYNQKLQRVQTSASHDYSKQGATEFESSLQIGQSRTCASLGKKSYKPSSKLTFMQYHDTNYIPPIYLMMWQDLLDKHYHSIAVSAVFKQQAEQIENDSAAAHWASY